MSAQANFFKIGLFVIGGTVALVLLLLILGSGQLFQSKITMETYLNESVQGLEVGSKVRYRGVVVGEVRRIGFTYNTYEQDQPMAARLRYVMVEATILPRLIGGRAGGDITRLETARVEIDRGLRVRLAPQGITGTSYLEIDYVDPKANPPLPITWTPNNLYIPSAQSTVTAFIGAASDIMSLDKAEQLAKLNLQAAKIVLENGVYTANAVAGIKDVQELAAVRAKLTEAGVQNALGYSRGVYQIASEAQADFSALAEQAWAAYTKGFAVWVDNATKNAPAGSDVAVTALKSTVAATTAAFDQFSKATKQVVSFADASVRAAAANAANATKPAAKGRKAA